MKLLIRLGLSAALILVAVVIAIYMVIFHYATSTSPKKADVMVVLGCQIWGKAPSWMLEYRLQKALDLYNAKYAPYIIVSGGQGKDEVTSEASVMCDWLVIHGVDKHKIIMEDKSTSTYENLTFSREIMDRKGFKSTVIVSNDFHIFRSLWLAKKLGITASGAPAQTVEYLKVYYNLREVLSVVKAFVLVR